MIDKAVLEEIEKIGKHYLVSSVNGFMARHGLLKEWGHWSYGITGGMTKEGVLFFYSWDVEDFLSKKFRTFD